MPPNNAAAAELGPHVPCHEVRWESGEAVGRLLADCHDEGGRGALPHDLAGRREEAAPVHLHVRRGFASAHMAGPDEVNGIREPRMLGGSQEALHEGDRDLVGVRDFGRISTLAGGSPNLVSARLPLGIRPMRTSHSQLVLQTLRFGSLGGLGRCGLGCGLVRCRRGLPGMLSGEFGFALRLLLLLPCALRGAVTRSGHRHAPSIRIQPVYQVTRRYA